MPQSKVKTEEIESTVYQLVRMILRQAKIKAKSVESKQNSTVIV